MARITPILGHQVLVKIGDGASPTEAFAHPALINTSRSITISTNTETDELIDIADQSAPAAIHRRVRSTDLKVDGAGMIHSADLHEWLEWSLSGEVKNCKVDTSTSTITVPMVLTQFQVSAERVKTAECQITLEQASPPTLTANS
jgi:hypothetical protein